MPENLTPNFPDPSNYPEKENFGKKTKVEASVSQTQETQKIKEVVAQSLGLEKWEQAQSRIELYGEFLEQREHNWCRFGDLPVLFWAPHALGPTPKEIERAIKLNRKLAITNEPLLGDTNESLEEKFKDLFDGYTGIMVTELITLSQTNNQPQKSQLGDEASFSYIVSNQPRIRVDQNRRPGKTTEISVSVKGFPLSEKKKKRKISVFSDESNRASLIEFFYLLREAIERSVGLKEGRAARPFLIIALHGMRNHSENKPGAEIIIGARGYASAHKKVVDWFIEQLRGALNQSSVLAGSTVAFEESGARNLPGDRVIEAFRQGDVSIDPSGLGEGLQVMQMEIVASIRRNDVLRQALEEILKKIAQQFPEVFPNLESLTEIST